MEQVFDELIDGMLQNGIGVIDNFLNESELIEIHQEISKIQANGKFHPAGIGRQSGFSLNTEIRSDEIFWVNEDDALPASSKALQSVHNFVNYLNRTCYTGLHGAEMHFAHYRPGSFYQRHLDRFRDNQQRVYTFICYLNRNWKHEDGGLLIAEVDGKKVKIEPLAGRVLFFDSAKIWHEVQATTVDRYSFTGWLLRKNGNI